MGDQRGPGHRIGALPNDGRRRQINENRPEQRQRNADASENEVFPRRFQRLVRPIDTYHQHRRQRRQFDRHPHQADIAGEQRQVHCEHKRLVHRVIEAQIPGRQARPVSSSWAM